MDRLSGDYKRIVKNLTLAIAFVVAIALNADSIEVGRALWNDSALRAQMVQAAGPILQSGGTVGPACRNDDPGVQIKCLLTQLKVQQEAVRPLPLGWSRASEGSGPPPTPTVGSVVMKVLGIAWTALALSLGAPFWFDLLQKFMNLRGAGVKPEEKPQPA
jgi:hypothetical protein